MQEPSSAISLLYNLSYFRDIILAIFGGATAYLFRYYQNQENDRTYKFSASLFFINAFLGGFLGYIIGTTVSVNNEYRDFIIGMTGVSAYPILIMLESNSTRIISKLIRKFLGINLPEPKRSASSRIYNSELSIIKDDYVPDKIPEEAKTPKRKRGRPRKKKEGVDA